jgi:hypothetical protein
MQVLTGVASLSLALTERAEANKILWCQNF